MKYIKITSSNDPKFNMIFYLELDNMNMERRKIEIANGKLLGFASNDIEFHGTVLAKEPLLTLSEINKMEKRNAHEIEKTEFEDWWGQVIVLLLSN